MGFFTGALALGKAFFGSSVGKMVGTAVLSRALQPKTQPAVLRYAEQTETNDANLEVMRQKAQDAGFNPLTVLRAGGINAYATRKTNIPSYAPQLSKGPSYLAIAAGAAAQSYFNRPTEEQKASQALKIAQQYADLDYTRAMTSGARNAGSGVSLTVPEKVMENYTEDDAAPPRIMFSATESGAIVDDKVKTTLYPKVAQDGQVIPIPWDDEILEGILTHAAVEWSAFDNRMDERYRKTLLGKDQWRYVTPPLADQTAKSTKLTGKMPAGALFDRYMDSLSKAGKWPIQ